MIAGGTTFGIELVQRLSQPRERLVIVEGAFDEAASFGQPIPDHLPKRRTGMVFDQLEHFVGKGLVVPIPAAESNQGESRGQQATVGQVVDRRHHLFAGQIPGDTEDHYRARAGYSR